MATVVSDPSYPLRATPRTVAAPTEVVAPATARPAERTTRARRWRRSGDGEGFLTALIGGLTGGFTAYGGRRR